MKASTSAVKAHDANPATPDRWSLAAFRRAQFEDQTLPFLLFGDGVASFSGGSPPFGVQSAETIRHGLPASALFRVQASFSISRTSLAEVLGLSPATIRRREKAGMLKPPEADRLTRLARILDHALRVFDDPARVSRWIYGRVPALGDRTPIELLDTDAGATEVDAVLTRIEHGVIG